MIRCIASSQVVLLVFSARNCLFLLRPQNPLLRYRNSMRVPVAESCIILFYFFFFCFIVEWRWTNRNNYSQLIWCVGDARICINWWRVWFFFFWGVSVCRRRCPVASQLEHIDDINWVHRAKWCAGYVKVIQFVYANENEHILLLLLLGSNEYACCVEILNMWKGEMCRWWLRLQCKAEIKQRRCWLCFCWIITGMQYSHPPASNFGVAVATSIRFRIKKQKTL